MSQILQKGYDMFPEGIITGLSKISGVCPEFRGKPILQTIAFASVLRSEMTLICSISVKRRLLPLSLRAAEMTSLGVEWKGPIRVLYSKKRGFIPEANPTKGSSQ